MSDSQSILVCIGCNKYDHLSDLKAAERDAEAIATLLTQQSGNIYSLENTFLLKSPTKRQIEDAFLEIFSGFDHINQLTIFFAGHSSSEDGSLVLAAKDTDPDKQLITGVQLQQLLSYLRDARPTHTYFIMDSCQSGGISGDLNAVLRDTIIGHKNGLAVEILAASTSDELASELDTGGLLTVELGKCISGKYNLRSRHPFLSLGEISAYLSDHPTNPNTQTFNYWGLSLKGKGRFCLNPHAPSRALSDVPSDVSHRPITDTLDITIQSALWAIYRKFPQEIDLSSIFSTQCKVREKIGDDDFLEFSEGVLESFEAKLNTRRGFDHIVTAIGFLGPAFFHAHNPYVNEHIRAILDDVDEWLLTESTNVGNLIQSKLHSLYDPDYGFLDLLYLPIRLSALLGWVGSAALFAAHNKTEPLIAELKACCEILLTEYGNSIVAISDRQAPGFLCFLLACKKFQWTSLGEEVVGRLFFDSLMHRAKVASVTLPPDRALDFLKDRAKDVDIQNLYKQDSDLHEHPSELLAVILSGAALFDLDEYVDPYLIELDHVHFNLFIPTSNYEFGNSQMSGVNHTYQVGHQLWRLNDWRREFQHSIAAQLDKGKSDGVGTIAMPAFISLALQDRTPWFLLADTLKAHQTKISFS